jgi:hypothetical protein
MIENLRLWTEPRGKSVKTTVAGLLAVFKVEISDGLTLEKLGGRKYRIGVW